MQNIITDIKKLHGVWMGILFSKYNDPHPVIGKYQPEGTIKKILYWFWAIIGIVTTVLSYPIVLVGLVLRIFTTSIAKVGTKLGITKTISMMAIVWASMIAGITYQYGFDNTLVLSISASIALVSLLISFYSYRNGGRKTTIIISYPAAYTAIFLPPVTAAILAPFGDPIINQSIRVAEYMLINWASTIGMEEWIRTNFELTGIYHAVMWFVISTIVGWITGLFIVISELIRPRN